MGKRQHQKDKMYITCNEWTQFYGGKQPDCPKSNFRRLPFDHCSLSLQPFEYPMCTPDGIIYDLMSIVPWLKKFGIDPITGKKLEMKSLIKLNFHKNNDGKYHCPVLYSVFTNNSHIMAIKTTGNVFCFEAIERLNTKSKNYCDLLTDEPFTKLDIITLQDPRNLDKFNISSFHHVINNLKVPDEEDEKARSDPAYHLKSMNSETQEILQELYREYKGDELLASTMKKPERKVTDKFNAAHYSTGRVASGFTSTTMEPETEHEAAVVDEDQVRYKFLKKKKGYVRLHTTKGDLNLELHCDMVPKTCENFILLCQRGYYDDTIFHRSIRNFMIQGGDPTGTGKGGDSAWARPFKDEFKPNLTHKGRGVLSMANSGPNCNKSQFFITFRSCQHLDRKHTVFGRVVGGLETLTAMESIDADPKTDRPHEDIKVKKTTIFVNPYEEADAMVAAAREKEKEKDELEKSTINKLRAESSNVPQVYRAGVGKYMNPTAMKRATTHDGPSTSAAPGKKAKGRSTLSDFSSW